MYGLSDEDLEIQARAREFADELIPFEVERGDERRRTADGRRGRARQAGQGTRACRHQHAHGARRRRLHHAAAGPGPGAGRPGDQRARPGSASTPPSWLPAVATPDQIERFVRPAIAGEREECYAITEEGAGSDVAAIEATARRDGDGYLLNGVKWHVTSFNTADFAFFQARLATAAHTTASTRCSSSTCRARGSGCVRTPAYSHTISHHHPIVAFTDVRVPAAHLVGAEGDGMSFAYEWFRFERLMVAARCLGAAERLTAEMTSVRQRAAGAGPADQRVRPGRGHARGQPHRAVRGAVADLRDRPRHRPRRST